MLFYVGFSSLGTESDMVRFLSLFIGYENTVRVLSDKTAEYVTFFVMSCIALNEIPFWSFIANLLDIRQHT